MDLVDKLSPAEVLSHLRDMGYHNITPLQLKEFVTDLKKLIVYDQLSSSSGSSSSSSSLSTSSGSESDYFSSNETLSNSSGNSIRHFKSKTSYPSEEQQCSNGRYGNFVCRASSKPASSVSSRSTLKRSSFSSSSLLQKPIQKENLPPRRERTKSTSGQTLEDIVKPKTSFIRSWKLQGKQSGSQKPAPNDPVKLYHHYQSLWAKHKCPGEDSRAELRWLIREKMLGQDPHLYSKPVSVKKNGR